MSSNTGNQAFLKKAREAGIQGLIIPDLPPEEGADFCEAAKAHDIAPILIYAPTTLDERMRELHRCGAGFIYCTARRGVTGKHSELDSDFSSYLGRCRAATSLPIAVGFGIQSRADIAELIGKADMAVIGSQTIKLVDEQGSDGRRAFYQVPAGNSSMTDSTQLNRELGTEAVLWKLDDLYASPGCTSFNDDCQWCRDQAQAIKKEYHNRIAALSAAELLALVSRLEALECRLGKLLTYSFLHFTTQIDNEAAGALYQQVHELANDCRKQSVFFELEWNNLEPRKRPTICSRTGPFCPIAIISRLCVDTILTNCLRRKRNC